MPILGIDEVGRGPLAGPLVVAAVILPEHDINSLPENLSWIKDLKDSKKLTPKKREALAVKIIEQSPAYAYGVITAGELDRLGMTKSLASAMRAAVKKVQKQRQKFTEIIIDGNVNYFKNTPLEKYTTTLVKGDAKIREISAASIIAKVYRDSYMTRAAAVYSGYGFDRNMGYGTKEHLAAISRQGLCPEHRLSFEPCASLTGFKREEQPRKNTTTLGARGEETVAEYLTNTGHEIIARNFKTNFCEIDIISQKDNTIFFTEVKYRKSDAFGGGLAAIDFKKQDQMRFAAETFLKFRPEFKTSDPLLAVATVTGPDFALEQWFPLD